MKRKIEDYKNKFVAIFCSSIEKWNKVNDLLGKKGLTQSYGDINKPDNTFVDCIHINGMGTGSKKYYEQQTYVIYPASDFLEEEFKFEEGKWYKNIGKDDKAYAKCKKFEKNQFYLSDHIGHDKRYRLYTDGSYFSKENYKNAELLTDLSEIQEALPEEHPDKIKTEIIPEYVEYIDTKYKGKIVKVEDWCCGSYCKVIFYNGIKEQPFKHLVKPSTKETYEAQNKLKQLAGNNLLPNKIYVTDDPADYIFKTSETSKGYSHYICEFKRFCSILNKDYIWKGNLRLATKEEKKWLNTCIKQDKFIPKEDLHLYDDSGLLVKMDEKMKSILEEAKERYPIGTKFKSVVTRNLFTVKNHVNEAKNSNIAFHTIESNSSGNHWGCVHENGTWAEIISLPNEQVQKEKSLVKQVEQGLKLKGRWLKCIKECDWNNITIGEYIQIVENHSIYPWVEKKDSKEQNSLGLERIDRKEFELMPEDFSLNEEEWIPKVGDWCVTTTHYNDEIWYKGRIWQIGKIDENGFCIPIKNKKLLEQSLKIGFRKALPHEIPNQYPLTPNESFQTTIYDFGDIHIPSITKKPKKLQTITIESTTDLNLGLTKIKSKQIQTIKI